jgi:hypothetical protein
MTACELVEKAIRYGLTITRVGQNLHVAPERSCPPHFADILRSQKSELLRLLIEGGARTPEQESIEPYRRLSDQERALLVQFCGNQNDPIIIAALNLFQGRIVGLNRRSRLHNQIQLDIFEETRLDSGERDEQDKKRGQ